MGGANISSFPPKETMVFLILDQGPFYDRKPIEAPLKGTREYDQLRKFSTEVEYILCADSDCTYQAACMFMLPPEINFAEAVVFPRPGMVLGKFGLKKVALVYSSVGSDTSAFPNAQFVVGVGICAFDNSRCKFSDVLVCEINSEVNFDAEGNIAQLQPIGVLDGLDREFSYVTIGVPFGVCKDNYSDSFQGAIVCSHLNSELPSQELLDNVIPGAIGYDSSGRLLLKPGNMKGMISIKGVAEITSEDWEFTAAMSALNFASIKIFESSPVPEGKVGAKLPICIHLLQTQLGASYY